MTGLPVTLSGIGVSPGVVAGTVARMTPPPSLPPDTGSGQVDVEAGGDQVRAALAAVGEDLDRRAAATKDKAAADVLAAQAMMVRDPLLARLADDALRAGRSAAHAVADAFSQVRATFLAAGGYLAERAADLDDLRNRTLAHVLGAPMPGLPERAEPYVLVADDLAPADTATLDPAQVLAIVTARGGPTSHTAILAKSMGIAAVVACSGAEVLVDDQQLLVDGGQGTVVVGPEEAMVAAAVAAADAQRAASAQTSGPGRTADGHAVKLLVNLGGLGELARAAATDAEGVGLFRTEFLFLDRSDAPTVDEQAAAYRRVFEAFDDRRVVVRTLDAGADKPLPFVDLGDEANPALGVRGLRVARHHPQLLDDQLAAIASARRGVAADVWVMAPMVATAAEAAAFVERAHAADLPVAGVMVEVPAAALRAGSLISACEFVSLGTNDLSQYVMAADRMSGELADLLDPWQPALLELVRLTCEAGRAAGAPVGVCGEAASDPLLATVLVGLGVTSLSMAPGSVAAVRYALRRVTQAQCIAAAREALAAVGAAEARVAAAAP